MDRKNPGPPADWDDSSSGGTPVESDEASAESVKQVDNAKDSSGDSGNDEADDDSIDGAPSLH